jgi:hypothetical protein
MFLMIILARTFLIIGVIFLSSNSPQAKGLDSKFIFSTKLLWANNSTADSSTIIERDLIGLGLDGMFGMENGPYILGVGVDYNLFRQITEKEEVNNTNTSGSMLSGSLALGLQSKRFVLLGKYYFYSQMALEQSTAEGNEQIYQAPSGSFEIQVHLKTGFRTFWALSYLNMTYSELVEGDREFNLTSELEVNYSAFGIMYGLQF